MTISPGRHAVQPVHQPNQTQRGRSGATRSAAITPLLWLAAPLLSALLFPATGRADLVLFNFTGEVIYVNNPTNPGIWGGINEADPSTLQISGQFSYDRTQPGVYVDGAFGGYYSWSNFDNLAHSSTDFSFAIALNGQGINYTDNGTDGDHRRRASLFQNAPAYDDEFFSIQSVVFSPSGVAEQLGIILPSDRRVQWWGVTLDLFSTQLSSPPGNLPSNFDNLWADPDDDYFASAGFMSVAIEDLNGNYVDQYQIEFSIRSVTSVPEPSTAFGFAIATLTAACLYRKRNPIGISPFIYR